LLKIVKVAVIVLISGNDEWLLFVP